MQITPALLDAFSSGLRQRGTAARTINTVVSDVRAAANAIPGPWDTTTDLAPFINASSSQQVRYNRRSSLTRLARWASLHGHGTITVPEIEPVLTSDDEAPAPDIDLAQLTQQIQEQGLPLDVQAIFLLLVEGGLMANETLMLNMSDVTISRTGGLLRVGDPARPYPLTTVHTPATIPVLLAWYQERRAAGAADHEPLFLTRQHNRRSQASLVPWWTEMFAETGLTRREVWQARRAEMMARHPTIAPSLLGAHGAPEMRAETLRQAILNGGNHDA